jgi:glycosyltransferase involved in cell wall biosynthesis
MLISVITVCYNSARTIGQTLESVASQSFTDYEHIVVDGASKDDTMDVVEAHRHERLSAVSEPDKGIYDAMNKGLARATGDYVQFLNSDDFLTGSDALGIAAAAMRASGADCVFGDTRFIEGDEARPGRRYYSVQRFRRWWVRAGVMPPHPSMFVKRDLLLKLGGFDTSYRISADFDLVARALLAEKAGWVTVPHAITNFRTGGLSTSGLTTKMAISRESARSLKALGQPLAGLSVLGRFPMKLVQFNPFRAR